MASSFSKKFIGGLSAILIGISNFSLAWKKIKRRDIGDNQIVIEFEPNNYMACVLDKIPDVNINDFIEISVTDDDYNSMKKLRKIRWKVLKYMDSLNLRFCEGFFDGGSDEVRSIIKKKRETADKISESLSQILKKYLI